MTIADGKLDLGTGRRIFYAKRAGQSKMHVIVKILGTD